MPFPFNVTSKDVAVVIFTAQNFSDELVGAPNNMPLQTLRGHLVLLVEGTYGCAH